ncbi:hypothetical protein pah_c209o047 [Parachlamydia acanthamoebae str. Hall's coccus]|nr:hypothetical protein pah_c209o047 [Parachlamydia acanthamoebae str. Hall's coccus]
MQAVHNAKEKGLITKYAFEKKQRYPVEVIEKLVKRLEQSHE